MQTQTSFPSRRQSSYGIFLGMLLIVGPVALSSEERGVLPGWCAILMVAGFVVYAWGVITYTRSKGYPGLLGLIAFPGLLGLVILWFLPDKRRFRTGSGAGFGDSDESDPHESWSSDSAAQRLRVGAPRHD